MKAIIENGGVKVGNIYFNQNGEVVNFPNYKIIALVIFDGYLNTIDNASNPIELRKAVAAMEFELHTNNVKNPFNSGFTKDGFGVYLTHVNRRVIFVECETDIEE